MDLQPLQTRWRSAQSNVGVATIGERVDARAKLGVCQSRLFAP